ncbi:MAG TPA: cell division protein CrgA [Actinomycetota bacterium]|nr:cell division protein CrgA [Actinomycetota bacterium]
MPKSKSKRHRYQPPKPPKPKPSPTWFGVLVLALLFSGVIMIVLNYLGFLLPGSPNNTYLWVGLGLIAVGFALATQWR